MEEKYKLHALCSLFPRLTGFEFECLNLGKSRLHGLHKFSQAMITAIPSKIHAGFFDVFHASVQTGDMNTTKKPISFDGLAVFLPIIDDVTQYNFTVTEIAETSPVTPKQSTAYPKDGSYVYFIQPIDGGLVKIGVTNDLIGRLSLFQCGSPVKLHIVKFIQTDDRDLERRVHTAFAKHRRHGEWFDSCVLEMEMPL